MIVDCHFHVDETMLTLEKMIEGMDYNNVSKTALIAPMNETMFELDSAFQHNLQRLLRCRKSEMHLKLVSKFMMV